ncbi:hypothetical protein G9F32_03565 [Acinetobacter sp. 194]|uniref:hypothetical protein n=1 Tax=Acinetobacter shaoyimingii TaxID=2715164 RepID=UPI0014089CF3|nr:hypothetical protein [Acinetobacter shaoyimingii]NHB57110.1 hypothetical protein [Acinetobacter shaoyimingii]
MKITSAALISLSIVLPSYTFAKATMDYVTSVQVNGIEINAPVAANQIEKVFGKPTAKISKEYSECTGNHDYTTVYQNSKNLRFEIFPEDNPQIKTNNFYKTKNNFQQLNSVKGHVWLTWNKSEHLSEQVKIGNKIISSKYTIEQFKKDFPISAKNKNNSVLMLNSTEVKDYLKNPNDYSVGYTSALNFKFKNGKLSSFEINQGIAC